MNRKSSLPAPNGANLVRCFRSLVMAFAIAILALFPMTVAQAQTVTVGWSGLGLTSRTTVPTGTNLATSDGNSVNIAWTATSNGSGGTFVPSSSYTSYFVYEAGSLGGASQVLLPNFDNQSFDTGDKITVTLTMTTAVTGLGFRLTDIDKSSWTDAVEVAYDTGTGTFVTAAPFATAGSAITATASGWVGNANVTGTSTAGDLVLAFGTTAVKRIRITYYSASGFGDPGGQIMGISSLTYTSANADLSLTKSVVTPAPFAGGNVTWRLTLANSSTSTGTPSSITVQDVLPTGFTFSSSSGTGTFSSATGNWTVSSLAPGSSATLDITGSISASAGAALANTAQVTASSLPDPDSTVNNGVTTEDDYTTVSFTVASGSRFTCDSRIYLSQNNPTQLRVTSANTSPLTFTNVGGTSAYYNAVGYNPADNFMYSLDSTTATSNRLYRIAGDGSVALLGTISGMPPVASIFYNAGVFVAPNKLLVRAGNLATNFYLIDVTTLSATQLTQPVGFTSNVTDFAYNPVTGKVYGVGDGILYEFTVGASSVTKRDIGPVGVAGFFGAMFSDSLGNLYGANNNGGFYAFNLTTGVASLISASPASSDNDGSNCYNAAITFAADPQVSKTDGTGSYTPGATQTYTIVVSNPAGPFGASGVTVSDPLPAGIVAGNVTWTAAVAGGATTSVTGSQTGALSDTVTVPVGGSVTYTVNIAVPANRTDSLVNTVTIATGGNVVDSNTANNTATDTDLGKALLQVTKTSSLVSDPVNGTTNPKAIPGAVVDYTITVTNTRSGSVDADTTFVVDALPAGITFFNGDANGAAPGTNAVNFSDSGSTLTFTYPGDVKYATGSTLPTSFAACTYTPAAGYDPLVRYICFNPKGTFVGATSPSTTGFTLQFRSRVE